MPSKYWRAFNLWSRIITAICVGGGIWLERYLDVNESYVLYAGVVVVAVALFVGHFLPEFVLTSLMSSWHFRRYLFGGAWIEGYWATITVFKDGAARRGIAQIKYAGERYSELDIRGWLKADVIVRSHSTSATVDERLHLVNYFKTGGPQPRTGVAVGELNCTRGKYPNEYDGMRFYVADDVATEVYQKAVKLRAKDVKKCEKLGDHWIEIVLGDSGNGSDYLLDYFGALDNRPHRNPLIGASK